MTSTDVSIRAVVGFTKARLAAILYDVGARIARTF